MTDQHPITPPPELVQQWAKHILTPEEGNLTLDLDWFANQAARWGADQQLKLDADQIAQAYQAGADMELNACCEWLEKHVLGPNSLGRLRAARRPKPPTLKERAQAELDRLIALIPTEGAMAMAEPIRKALEALPND